MSVSVDRSGERRITSKKETIVDFSPAAVKAPFVLRCGALLIDYIVIISIPVACLLASRAMGNDGAKLLNSELNNVGWLVAVLVALTNILLLPMIGGQTAGKMLTGLRIVGIDGSPASSGTILFRQLGGYLITAATLGIGFFSSVLSSKGRALHDYIAGTVVIYATKRPR